MTTIGQRIRELRIARGLSQIDLSKKSGVAQGYLSQLEADKKSKPGFDVLRALLLALDYDLDALNDVMLPQRGITLEEFAQSDIGQQLGITQEEIHDLAGINWHLPHEGPTIEAWRHFLEARRALQHK